jgi:hypothetical protein
MNQQAPCAWASCFLLYYLFASVACRLSSLWSVVCSLSAVLPAPPQPAASGQRPPAHRPASPIAHQRAASAISHQQLEVLLVEEGATAGPTAASDAISHNAVRVQGAWAGPRSGDVVASTGRKAANSDSI